MEEVMTLEKAIILAKQKAKADVYGFSDPFSAVQFRKSLPKEWQVEVEAVIVEIYHNT